MSRTGYDPLSAVEAADNASPAALHIGDYLIQVTAKVDPAQVPWDEYGVDGNRGVDPEVPHPRCRRRAAGRETKKVATSLRRSSLVAPRTGAFSDFAARKRRHPTTGRHRWRGRGRGHASSVPVNPPASARGSATKSARRLLSCSTPIQDPARQRVIALVLQL